MEECLEGSSSEVCSRAEDNDGSLQFIFEDKALRDHIMAMKCDCDSQRTPKNRRPNHDDRMPIENVFDPEPVQQEKPSERTLRIREVYKTISSTMVRALQPEHP